MTAMLQPLTRLHAVALPLPRDNIDTDALIPVWENTRVSPTGFGDALFAGWRYTDGLGHTPDQNFILNRPPYDRAKILVAGSNFGCGSSRESAVWALRDFGFLIIIAVSFNETFKRNCIVNGLAPLVMARADAEQLIAAISRNPEYGITVDLDAGHVRFGSGEQHTSESDMLAFELDSYYCGLLTTGRTEDDVLAGLRQEIEACRSKVVAHAPWLNPDSSLLSTKTQV